MGAAEQGRDKKWVPEYTMYTFSFRSEAIYGFAYPWLPATLITTALTFSRQNDVGSRACTT